jgi:hypothetical protein
MEHWGRHGRTVLYFQLPDRQVAGIASLKEAQVRGVIQYFKSKIKTKIFKLIHW